MTPAEQIDEICNSFVERIGEHAPAYILAAQVPDHEDETKTRTIVLWHGGVDLALGLLARAKIRVDEVVRRTDFAPSPEEN